MTNIPFELLKRNRTFNSSSAHHVGFVGIPKFSVEPTDNKLNTEGPVGSASVAPSVFVSVIRGPQRADGVDVSSTFSLSFRSAISVPISMSATAIEMKKALQELVSVGSILVHSRNSLKPAGNSGSLFSSWAVTFSGDGTPAHLGDLPLIVATSKDPDVIISVHEEVKGSAESEIVSLECGLAIEGGRLTAQSINKVTIFTAPKNNLPEVVIPLQYEQTQNMMEDGALLINGITVVDLSYAGTVRNRFISKLCTCTTAHTSYFCRATMNTTST